MAMKRHYRIFRLVLLLAVVAVVGGCVGLRNQKNADQLRAGMTKEQVLAVMGEPIQGEVYTRPDIWFYFIRSNWLDGQTTEEECMPLVFQDGRLIGWGNEFYVRYQLKPSDER